MVMVPGLNNVIRVNGTARLSVDPDLRARFAKSGKQPTTVIVVQIAEVYSQCARAMMRAGLWAGDPAPDLPSVGQMLAEIKQGFDGASYDSDWGARAMKTMW